MQRCVPPPAMLERAEWRKNALCDWDLEEENEVFDKLSGVLKPLQTFIGETTTVIREIRTYKITEKKTDFFVKCRLKNKIKFPIKKDK